MEHPTKPGCLIMAAGNASRFRANKLAARFDGKPLIRRALEAVPAELFARVVVVTQYPQVEELAAEFGFEAICNPHPDYGISYTIRLGTQALSDCGGILYMVSDQPLLASDSVAKVVQAWLAHPDRIVGAAHNGKRGNPCIFPKKFFPELLALTGDTGGSRVIRQHEDLLRLVEIPPEELYDCDTKRALDALKASTGAS